jgi:hypothetical protein
MSFLDFEIRDENLYEFNSINEIVPGLWLGALPIEIPSNINHVFSMIGPQHYSLKDHQKVTVVFFDDKPELPSEKMLHDLANSINISRQNGHVLVHCLAGLNRSGLVLGLALVKSGIEAKEAITLMRAKRSPSVLFNKVFHDWLLDQ